VHPEEGRQDGGCGVVLKGDGQGGFQALNGAVLNPKPRRFTMTRCTTATPRLAALLLLATAAISAPTAHAATPPSAGAAAPASAASAPASGSCTQQATDRKLAGAAKSSFLTKCEREATERCEAAATEKKLAGAARTGNVNKCVKEAVGS
ncbi:MAG: hypothetical protein ACKOB5_08890, partial [Betaproteobacteria bacterium]